MGGKGGNGVKIFWNKQNRFKVMDKIYDWAGNEVKAGMTIYFVQTKPSFLETARVGWLMPQTGETVWEDEKEWEDRKSQEVWELGQEYTVVNTKGGLQVRMDIKDNEDLESIIFPIYYMFGEKPTIAIKGISDKKPNPFPPQEKPLQDDDSRGTWWLW